MPEKDYMKLARDAVVRPQDSDGFRRILAYGRNKKGKTYFSVSAGIEQTLVLDPEGGTDPMKRLNPYVWPIRKWEDIDTAYHALRTGRLSPKALGKGESTEPFTWVSVDGLTKMNNMALRFVMSKAEEANLDRKPGMVDRRDYGKSGELMKGMLLNFNNLRMGVVYTAQERMMTADAGDSDEDDESTFFVPDLPAAVRSSVNAIVDVIGRLYVVKAEFKIKGSEETIERNQRRLYIGLNPRYDTGFRSDYDLPDYVKSPTIPKLVKLMEEGV